MTQSESPSFAFFAMGDAYSMSGKIMGRQSAGEGFIRGLARTWPKGTLQALITKGFNRTEIEETLRSGGFAGSVRWTGAPEFTGARAAGTAYFPAPPSTALARVRNRIAPAAYSLMGVTHTVSTDRTLDGISTLVMAPFKPWDALICTSRAALSVVETLLEETREDLSRHAGVERFTKVQLPVIPLGVNCDRFAPATAEERATARANFVLEPDEVVVLFAGRLSFHAKANPAVMYQALQAVAKDAKIVCIEAGLYPNDGIKKTFRRAQKAIAPDVRFVHAPGDSAKAYAAAWKAADIFCSLSDNIQETFGLTPVEAMAAGLPVVVTDWNGYRDNVRHGQDGFLIPTLAAAPGAGEDMAVAVETELLTYDRFIGAVSLGVAVDGRAAAEAFRALATDADLRQRMGQSARQHAVKTFDWPVVLRAYDDLARQLAMIRAVGEAEPPETWPQRADPFRRFAGFATRVMDGGDKVKLHPDVNPRLAALTGQSIAEYGFEDGFLAADLPRQVLNALNRSGGAMTVQALLAVVGGAVPANQRALAWLAKFGLVEITRA